MLSWIYRKFVVILSIFLITTLYAYSDFEENSDSLDGLKIQKELELSVTCYYTPVEWQSKYFMGNYNAEIRLTWGGKHMSSWKEVYSWAIAAPKEFPFGSQIYIEWFWIWIVEDRWWAIQTDDSWVVDIDVWMWTWDEWYSKCANWWRKKLKWYLLESTWSIEVWNMLDISNISNVNYSDIYMTPESWEYTVKVVQKLFKDLYFYDWEIDWKYDKIKNILIRYQIQKWIVSWFEDEEAWYFGKKTIKSLEEEFWLSLEKERKIPNEEKEYIIWRIKEIKFAAEENYEFLAEQTREKIKSLKEDSSLSQSTIDRLNYLEIVL